MTKCSIEGCEKEHASRGYCQTHYMRWRKHGDATKVSRVALRGKSLDERFECQVIRKDGCWDWTGHKDSRGYCRIMVDGKIELAHRVSWQMTCGKIPENMVVCHRCDNPSCVNPEHLFLDTQWGNLADMRAKGRDNQPCGEANGNSSLRREDIYYIRASRKKPSELADHFNMTPTGIRRIQRRETWKHLPERR